MYKLMINNGSILITGNDLVEILNAIFFEVPVIVPLVRVEPLPMIPKPIAPTGWLTDPIIKAEYIATYKEYAIYVKAVQTSAAEAKIENAIREVAYFKQFQDFADYLDYIFCMTKKVIVGLDRSGQRIYEYVEVPATRPNYTFLQAAEKLMGKGVARPIDPIDFIANEYFK